MPVEIPTAAELSAISANNDAAKEAVLTNVVTAMTEAAEAGQYSVTYPRDGEGDVAISSEEMRQYLKETLATVDIGCQFVPASLYLVISWPYAPGGGEEEGE